jgi:preprotein translocase subunit YajC
LIAASGGGGSGFFLIVIIGFLLIWLIFVRPQRKRQTHQQQMLSDLRVGDEVLTAGGIFGTISQLDDDSVTVEIAPRTEVRVARRAIAGVTRDEPDPGEDEEHNEPEESDEPQDDDAERWQSAFDDEGSSSETSNEEKPG